MSLTPVTVNNATDTSISEAQASRNFSGSTRLRLQSTTPNQHYAFIYFSRPFPLGSVISSATLKLYGADAWSTVVSRTLTAKRVTSPWGSSTITWNVQPTVNAADAVSATKTTALADGEEWALNVAAHMQLVADGQPWYGWRLELNEATLRYLYSAEGEKLKPVLEVTYAQPPAKPSTLSPSGGRSVSIAKPTLRFDFTDQAGDALNKVHVQLNATDVWTAPSFDSGEVTAAAPELNLASTAYAGLANAATTYWRCRVQDISGLWSAWSNSTTFRRDDKAALTIVNPATAPNNFVDEATPPFSWSFAGTQTAWQVIVADTAGTWLYTSGKISGTATSHTPTSTLMLQDGTTYNLIVRVWDNVNREATPGDPAYIEASRSFSMRLTAGVTGVSGLTATAVSPPGVQLNWTRATAPDRYTITRDGVVIAANLVPNDLFVGGTSYRYTDNGAKPNTQHTYTVRAVVNGQTSSTNPTASATVAQVGIWLADTSRGIAVHILDAEQGSWAMFEQAETHRVLGSRKPVRITQTLGGYEGQITGRLITHDGVSTATWEDRMLDLKARAGRTYWLSLSDMSFPVVIGNVVVAPTPDAEISKLVTFDFWQVGEFTFEATL